MKGRKWTWTDAQLDWVRSNLHRTPSHVAQYLGVKPAVAGALMRKLKYSPPIDYGDRGAPACLVAGMFGHGPDMHVLTHAADIKTATTTARAMGNRKAVVYVRLDLLQGE